MIKPYRDYVVLKEIKVETTKSGFILPEYADVEKTQTAEVVDVGPQSDLKKGKIVLFKPYLFDKVILGSDEYLVGESGGVFAQIND